MNRVDKGRKKVFDREIRGASVERQCVFLARMWGAKKAVSRWRE